MTGDISQHIIGTVVTTIHGNKLRRFEDGWSPLEGAHWDRWTVYTDDELTANLILADPTFRDIIGTQQEMT